MVPKSEGLHWHRFWWSSRQTRPPLSQRPQQILASLRSQYKCLNLIKQNTAGSVMLFFILFRHLAQRWWSTVQWPSVLSGTAAVPSWRRPWPSTDPWPFGKVEPLDDWWSFFHVHRGMPEARIWGKKDGSEYVIIQCVYNSYDMWYNRLWIMIAQDQDDIS